jgi:hypothetical protein
MSQDAEKVITKYIELRDRKSGLKKQYDSEVAKLDEAMEVIETYLMSMMKTLGVDSLKASDAGTAYRTVRTKASIDDRAQARAFVLKTGNLDLFELRASGTGVKTYLEEHKALPPGFSVLEEETVNIRRAN